MDDYMLGFSSEEITYEGSTVPFWDLWVKYEGDDQWRWTDGVSGVEDLGEARRILGVPEHVELEDAPNAYPYTKEWKYHD